MARGRLYPAIVSVLLVAAVVMAWRTWSRASAGSFDPVSAVISVVSLAVGVAAFSLAIRAQRQADTDVAAAAERLAVAVKQSESEARRQLLGSHDKAIDVQFDFQPVTAQNIVGTGGTGTLAGVSAYYSQLRPQRMVITGAAGSGKTVLALGLILDLLENRAADAPVPVRMSAAALDVSRPVASAVADWVTGHLRQVYGLPLATAQQLVSARMVIPVLDGLDEMDAAEAPGYASRAGQVIRACNAYLDGSRKAAVVLTCRISQYEALAQAREWVHDAARIQLRPVGAAAAVSFLASRDADESRWQPVLRQLQDPGTRPLASALSTPWRLTLAATVYNERDATGAYLHDPADLTAPVLGTEDSIRDHLLSLYIPATLAAHRDQYPAGNVHHWLGVLAGYLAGNAPAPGRPARVIAGRSLSGTDLVLHELWPLAGTRAPRVLATGALAAMAAVSFVLVLVTDKLAASYWIADSLLGFALAVMVIRSWLAWPPIILVDLRRLKASRKRRDIAAKLASELKAGLVIGLIIWFAARYVAGGGGLPTGLATRLGGGLIGWLAEGFLAGLAIGLVSGLVRGFKELVTDSANYSATGPRQIVRAIFTVELGAGPAAGLAAGLTGALEGRFPSLAAGGIAWGPMAGLIFGIQVWLAMTVIVGATSIRYIAFLLCTRRWTGHWLPWRLGRFLHWCQQIGLIRAAGISYQFRHRELQDYLARNPAAKTASRDRAGVSP